MYQVAVIGAGQLGSRHLQGLKNASSPLSITVMDSSEDSLKIARERYDSVVAVGEKMVKYVTCIENLPIQLDLVIIATGARPRASIIKNLLRHSMVKYLLLEKVLFTQLSDYDEIENLLRLNNVTTWVNCPRRMFGAYNVLKQYIDYSSSIQMTYIGQEWGLCCNSMHFIDVFMYLVQEDEYSIFTSGIEPKIIDSKRAGYIEMLGTLRVETDRGNQLILSSLEKSDQLCKVIIDNGKSHYSLDEQKGVLCVNGKEQMISIPYQSQTSGILADGILRMGYCPLTPFQQSAKYHKVFIEKMLEQYNSITGKNATLLPIT